MSEPQLFSPYRVFTGVFIPDALIAYRGINAAEKICLARLYRYCGKSQSCWPSQEELATELGVEERTVRLYIQHLEEDGFIQTSQRGLRETNLYSMVWHPVFRESEQDHAGLDRQEFTGQDRRNDAGLERRNDAGPLHLLTEESHTKRVNIENQNLPSGNIGTTPLDVNSINWISKRFKSAGKKLNTADKRSLTEWLGESDHTEEEVEAALALFLADEYWKERGLPVAAFKSQFQKFLDQVVDASSGRTPQDAPPPTPPAVTTEQAPAPPPAAPAAHWRTPWIEMWNQIVTAAPVAEWDAGDDKLLNEACKADAEFIGRFREMCEQAQKIHANDACGWLTLQWILRIPKGETSRNWRKLFKSLAWRAEAKMSGSGQKQPIDIEELTRKEIEKL